MSSHASPATGGSPCDTFGPPTSPPSRSWLGRPSERLLLGDSPAHGEPPRPGLIRLSPWGGGSDDPGVPRAPSSSRVGTSPMALVRGSSHFPDDPVPQPWVGAIELPQVPVLRGPMAWGDTATGVDAMAVNSQGDAPGDVLGEEEEIDGALASLLSASWPTPAVMDDRYQQFSWDLGGSLVEQRYTALEGFRMVCLWKTIQANYGSMYAVPAGTVTDFPLLRRQEDWRGCRVLRHLAERDLFPEVGDKPHFS